MMKLFFVIYIAGQIGGTIGPLPYGMEECQSRAEEAYAEGNPSAITQEGLTMRDVRFACEWHDQRPQNQR